MEELNDNNEHRRMNDCETVVSHKIDSRLPSQRIRKPMSILLIPRRGVTIVLIITSTELLQGVSVRLCRVSV